MVIVMCSIFHGRDGISGEHHEHASVRNLADCVRIFWSPCKILRLNLGNMEEMFQMSNNVDGVS